MKNLIGAFGLLLINVHISAQKQKTKQVNPPSSAIRQEIKIPFTADRWEFQEGKVEFLEYKGLKAVKLNESSGNMICKDLNFINGTIEFDVEVNQAQPF